MSLLYLRTLNKTASKTKIMNLFLMLFTFLWLNMRHIPHERVFKELDKIVFFFFSVCLIEITLFYLHQ